MVKWIRGATRRRRARAGTSTVEMAIVLPLLLLLVFAIGDFGLALTRWNSLTNAVREGARLGVVFRSPCDAPAVTAQIESRVATFASSSGLDPASIATTVTNVCAPTGTPLTVQATAPYNWIGMQALAGFAPVMNLNAQTVMRNE